MIQWLGNWSEDWGSCHSWVGANLHTPIPNTFEPVSLVSCLQYPVCSNKHFPKEATWCLRNIGRLGQSCALGRPPGIDGKPWTQQLWTYRILIGFSKWYSFNRHWTIWSPLGTLNHSVWEYTSAHLIRIIPKTASSTTVKNSSCQAGGPNVSCLHSSKSQAASVHRWKLRDFLQNCYCKHLLPRVDGVHCEALVQLRIHQ